MLIFAMENRLYVHHCKIIYGGIIQVIGSKNEIVKEFIMPESNYCSVQLDLSPGKYLVKVTDGKEKFEKSIIVKLLNNKDTEYKL